MNILHKVTIESLKKNRARTLVTIIGIMLSTALICSVTLSIYSAVCFGKDYVISETGDWHGSAYPLSAERVESLRANSEVKDVFCVKAEGFSKIDTGTDTESSSTVNYWDQIAIFSADSQSFEYLPFHLKSGRYPENSTEIIVSSAFLNPDNVINNDLAKAGKPALTVGSEIDLNMIADVSDVEDVDALESDEPAEMLRTAAYVLTGEKRKYTIVGVFEQYYVEHIMSGAADMNFCVTKLDENPGAGIYNAFFHMKKASDTKSFLNREFNMNDPANISVSTMDNDELLMFSLSSGGAGFISFVLLVAAIVIGLIMFGSIALIYNAFAISVSERTKQFGLLSSIGATKKQINRMIEFEALSLSIVGIPLGVLLGICGISVTFRALGSRFASITGLMTTNNIKMELHISWIVILISALLALFTVRLSAWIPSARAQRITAVEAIRQSGDIKANNKHVRTSKITYKLFGLPGVLAKKYFKRSKKRYRATVVSLFMSIVLFISAYAFTSYLVTEMENEYTTNAYDICYETDLPTSKQADELLEKFRTVPEVDKAACSKFFYIPIRLDPDDLTSDIKEADHRYQSEDKWDSGRLMFVDDDLYREYLKENGYSTDKYMDPDHPVALSYDIKNVFDIVTDRTNRYHRFNNSDKDVRIIYGNLPEGYERDMSYEGGVEKIRFEKTVYADPEGPDEIILTHDEWDKEISINVGESIDKAPFFMNAGYSDEIFFVYPESFRDKITPGAGYEGYTYTFLSKNHAQATKDLKEIIGDAGLDDEMLYDYAAEAEATRNMVLIVKVFAYGFIILISLIAAANVFNTISTNVALRKREFAMLRSVGMSTKGLNRMMNYECLLYGTRSLITGIPAAFGVTYLIYRSFNMNFQTTFRIPWTATIISAASVFIVVFSTMIYSMKKIKKVNPIDALKNENT